MSVERKEQRFFLGVVHGGMLLYLLLHNIVIPLFKNFNPHYAFFDGMKFWFLPHLYLFYKFITLPPRAITWVPVILWSTLYTSLLRMLWWLLELNQHAATAKEFSEIISIASNLLFLFLFLRFFRPSLQWSTPWRHPWKEQLGALVLTGVMFGFALLSPWQTGGTYQRAAPVLPAQRSKAGGCFAGESLSFRWPTHKTPQGGQIIISSCGLSKWRLALPSGEGLVVLNQQERSIPLRLEVWQGRKFVFKSFASLRPRGEFRFESKFFAEGGLYQLFSDARPELGRLLIFVPGGEKSLAPGQYLFEGGELRYAP